MKKIFILFMLFITSCYCADLSSILGLNSDISKNEKQYTCTPVPPAKPPAQHSGAEGVPPLPLPAVPLRRTEKKNPPRPPVLIAKISTSRQSDWATNPADTENLLKWMAKDLNVHFSSINMQENSIPSDPKTVPILYRTGHDAFTFSDDIRKQIRSYLIGGGTIIFDACCGRKDFFLSAYNESKTLIPEREPYLLPNDHPIYKSFFDISSIKYRDWAIKTGANQGIPSILGVDINCRTAIFISRWDLSCGWDGLADSERHHCLGYDIETSKKIGSNLMAYITAERSVAIPLSKAMEFVDAEKTRSGKFQIAQIKYNGVWKTREAGLSMLLDSFNSQTKTPVLFHRTEISLDSPALLEMPFIYLTGHEEFEFTSSERIALRTYLSRGGILFAEACCGRKSFDNSFTKEMRIILGDNKLEQINRSNPIFSYPNNISKFLPRPALSKNLNSQGKIDSVLFGCSLNGTLSVIYSPYGLCCGWELAQCPYCSGINDQDALALGVNILSFAVMQ